MKKTKTLSVVSTNQDVVVNLGIVIYEASIQREPEGDYEEVKFILPGSIKPVSRFVKEYLDAHGQPVHSVKIRSFTVRTIPYLLDFHTIQNVGIELNPTTLEPIETNESEKGE